MTRSRFRARSIKAAQWRILCAAFAWIGFTFCATACLSAAPPPAEALVEVRYRATDDVPSRFAAASARLGTDPAQARQRTPAHAVGSSIAAQPLSQETLARLKEELLARSAEGRKETQLVALGLEAFERGDLSTALAQTREAWLSLQETRSRTLDEDLATSPVREVALAYASALVASSEHKEGVVLLERLAVGSPRWLPAYAVLFEHYMRQRAFQLAERVARRAVSFAGELAAEPHVLLARALRAQGNSEAAAVVLERARTAFPVDGAVTLWLALARHDAGFLTEACEGFSMAYSRMSANEDAAYNHGLCLAGARKWEEAVNVVKLGLTQNPQSGSLRLLAGNVLRLTGRDAEAYKVWKEFLDLSPQSDPRRASVENAVSDLRRPSASEANPSSP